MAFCVCLVVNQWPMFIDNVWRGALLAEVEEEEAEGKQGEKG